MLMVQVVAGWKYHIVLHLGITTEPACLGAATQKIVKIANCPGADLVGPIFYLTISLLRLFQQHYRQYGTGQSQESEGSYKPRGSSSYQTTFSPGFAVNTHWLNKCISNQQLYHLSHSAAKTNIAKIHWLGCIGSIRNIFIFQPVNLPKFQ